MKFYRILTKKTQKYLIDRGKSIWEHSEIIDLKSAVMHRQANKFYKFNDFIVVKFELDKIPKQYYVYNGELLDIENHKDMVEGLYE